MSETAEQRTKRRFSEYLDLTTWKYQYSFFYQCSMEARACALSDALKLREKLRRTNILKCRPFLYRLCLYKTNAFHTVFTTEKIDLDLLNSIASKASDVELRILGRKASDAKIQNYKRAIKRQKPHNLVGFFGDKKINRISLINKNCIDSGFKN